MVSLKYILNENYTNNIRDENPGRGQQFYPMFYFTLGLGFTILTREYTSK